MVDNEKIVDLLRRDPSAFLETHQSMIRGIVMKYMASGLFRNDETDDVYQYINERLLTGVLEKMRNQYNSSYYIRTYFSKIISNLCLQYANMEGRRNLLQRNVDFSDVDVSTDETITADIVLKEMYEHLVTVLALFGTKRPRLELLMKITLKIGISRDDILRCYPDCKAESMQRLLAQFQTPDQYSSSSLTVIYETLIPLLNELEGKQNTADALRKWVDSKLDEIAEILNVPPVSAALNRETVKILIEKYYREFPKIG